MSMTGQDIFGTTMVSLEAGLQVHLIATRDLKWCRMDDDIAAIRQNKIYEGFDHIPVRDGERIVGVVELLNCPQTGAVKQHMRSLDSDVLVSGSTSLREFLSLMLVSPYRFVLDGADISSIVTRSDLQKLPVRLYAFALITHLEMTMRDAILALLPQDEMWLGLLGPERRQNIEDKWRSLQRNALDLAKIEATDFCDKRDILRKYLHLGRPFDRDLHRIEDVRNSVAHASTYGETYERIQHFIACLQQVEQWIGRIEQEVAVRKNELPPVANSLDVR